MGHKTYPGRSPPGLMIHGGMKAHMQSQMLHCGHMGIPGGHHHHRQSSWSEHEAVDSRKFWFNRITNVVCVW